MNIGIDIDDTISETFEALLPYSQKYTIEDLKRKSEINMNQIFLNHFFIENMNAWNKQESMGFWNKYYGKILREVNIKKFASEVINKLKQEGHKIYLITARWDMPNDNTQEITKQWLSENNVEYDELIINASDKLKEIEKRNIDIFIDDSFDNCKTIAENSSSKVYMMTSRVNGKFKHEKIQRVYSWPEVYSLIEKMKEEDK